MTVNVCLNRIFVASGMHSAFSGCCVCEIDSANADGELLRQFNHRRSSGTGVRRGAGELTISEAAYHALHCGQRQGHVSVIEMTSYASGKVGTEYVHLLRDVSYEGLS